MITNTLYLPSGEVFFQNLKSCMKIPNRNSAAFLLKCQRNTQTKYHLILNKTE